MWTNDFGCITLIDNEIEVHIDPFTKGDVDKCLYYYQELFPVFSSGTSVLINSTFSLISTSIVCAFRFPVMKKLMMIRYLMMNVCLVTF